MNKVIDLNSLEQGQLGEVAVLREDLNPRTLRRLQDLGFTLGAAVCLERRLPFGGPIVVRVGGGIVALERTAAECILVETKANHE